MIRRAMVNNLNTRARQLRNSNQLVFPFPVRHAQLRRLFFRAISTIRLAIKGSCYARGRGKIVLMKNRPALNLWNLKSGQTRPVRLLYRL
jgi:hypothetical protein